ncbi:TIGR04283 family arsenosugar biosynthesis glycosyltransferase [Aquimarina aquimarini]|uniref:TIGR04283 family arsenosugar biosynthesis glycosyltransferase n=1 Tax=Aquimarina aquimarini TaxID=1191734 RepID=UPI001EFF7513|nr:TIGR04283 family arsenosugar biosynthesis glycosyltransferase [Aquimarina aquimarini]
MKISIIIPILNESEIIGKLISILIQSSFSRKNIQEILIVDGGSTDRSKDIIDTLASQETTTIKFIPSQKGRAKQLNTGARIAQGNILYFLHADSYPPKGYDDDIIQEVKKGNNAGCFRMKFNSNHWWLRFLGWLTQFHSKRCRGGDQSQFITTSLFKQIDGYDESFIVYEDNDLVERLFAIQQFVIIPKNVITSARRYKEIGIWRLQYYFLNIHMRKWMGASPEKLYRYYKKKVGSIN